MTIVTFHVSLNTYYATFSSSFTTTIQKCLIKMEFQTFLSSYVNDFSSLLSRFWLTIKLTHILVRNWSSNPLCFKKCFLNVIILSLCYVWKCCLWKSSSIMSQPQDTLEDPVVFQFRINWFRESKHNLGIKSASNTLLVLCGTETFKLKVCLEIWMKH